MRAKNDGGVEAMMSRWRRFAVAASAVAMLGPAVTAARADTLPAPTITAVQAGPSGKAELVITRVAGATSYKIRRIPQTFVDDATCQAALRLPPFNANIGSVDDPGPTDLSTTVTWDETDSLPSGTYSYAALAFASTNTGQPNLSNCVQWTVAGTPPAFASFTATVNATSSTVTLRWTVVSADPITGFSIRRTDGPTPPASSTDGVAACPTDTTSPCTDHGLVVGNTYTYAAFASNASGITQSTPVTVTIPAPPPPPAPDGFRAVAGDGIIALRWKPVSGASSYTLVGQPGTTAPSAPTAGTRYCPTAGGQHPGCVVTGLVNGQPMSFALFAYSPTRGYSHPATVTGITPRDTTPPPTPQGLRYLPGDGLVWLGWTGVGGDVAGYRITVSPDAGTGCADLGATATSCVVAGLTNGQTYRFSLSAFDAAGNESAPATIDATPSPDRTAPTPPANVRATAGDGTALVQWDPVGGDVIGYRVVATQGAAPATDPNGPGQVCDLSATATSCLVPGLSNGVAYTFTLWAYDPSGNFSPAVWVSAMPAGAPVSLPAVEPTSSPAPPPVPLAAVAPTAAAVVDRTPPARPTVFRVRLVRRVATLTWRNPADADFAYVFVVRNARHRPTRPQDGLRVYRGRLTTARWIPTPGSTTHLAIFAFDEAGNVSAGAFADLKAPRASKLLPASGATLSGSPLLRWVPVKRATYYNVQVFQGKKRVAIAWPRVASWKLPRTKLRAGATYVWYVWPAFGPRRDAHYGKLIGVARFRYR